MKQNEIRNIVFGWLYLCIIFGIPGFAVSAETVDRIVAVVNDEIITFSDLQKAMAVIEKQIEQRPFLTEAERQKIFELREKMLDKLIDEKLTDQEIERLQLKVSDSEIDEAIEQIKSKNYLTDETLRAALAKEGMTLEEYRDSLKMEMLRPRLINAEVKSKIVITDEDIKAYYDSHKEEFAGFKKHHLWHLVVPFSGLYDTDDIEKIKEDLNAALAELSKGTNIREVVEDFSAVSQNYSGGDLGLFKLEELSATLKDAVSGLSQGEYTKIIETPNGFQVLYLEEIVEVPAKTVEAVSSEISEKLYNEVVNEKFTAWLEGLRENSHIKIIQ